jgi:hypothetical protein
LAGVHYTDWEEKDRDIQAYKASAIRSLRVFAGDLSWIERDLESFAALTRSGKSVQLLTTSTTLGCLDALRAARIQVANYPFPRAPELRGTIIDAENPQECRLIWVIKRARGTLEQTKNGYSYTLKALEGIEAHPIISSFATAFDYYFEYGTKLI